ncbi:phosphotransferase family protein [Cellulomonas marina]|uniref:Predicted kinase, aminoglycoside phosphotransferase (APT) family n=1 Tax=Cellulomonas marina TaxID=988821 RepID=A0A1I1AJ89_9CELL|nr:phosphotransferase [Cellulomonas marina]GIG30141.1 aminoglycoside phosphotransferase [Cellulomonas marina]SFB38085.1 Predicted kinase, aminoglycoside phosphotransferase (APT) family [Cellulomonas marina]
MLPVTASITKNRQTPATLRAMLARAYGPDQVPDERDGDEGWWSELGHGWFNVAYRLRLRDGREVVAKIAPPADVEVMTYERGAMGIELATIALLRERTEVPVPEVHHVDTTHDLVDADWFTMALVEGEDLGELSTTLLPAELDRLDAVRGDLTRRINEVRGPWFGPLAGPGERTWRATFTRLVEDVLRDGERRAVDTGVEPDEVRALLRAHGGTLEEVTEPRLVEWDLWPPNVMVHDGEVVAVIDHERAFYGDPLVEAGFCGITTPELGDPAAFLRGYGHPGVLTDTELRRRQLYSLHLLLVMVVETVYRGHTDPTQYDWARARLAEVVAALRDGRP